MFIIFCLLIFLKIICKIINVWDKYNDLCSFANSNNTQGIIENGRICDFATKINIDLSNIGNFIYIINQNTKCINSYIYINGDLFSIIHNENEPELLKKAKEIYI